jgi:hypothetical protein
MAYGNTFKRCEMKFILTPEQYAAVRKAISPYMTEDKYGKHTICNIYCDTDNSDLIRTSLDKPIYKEKLRLRTYGTAKDDGASFLEIKKKFKGVVYKRRVQMPYKVAFDYINGVAKPDMDKQELHEIDYMIRRLSLKPKIVICYDRRAFFGNEDKEFRITFDSNVRSRTENIDLRVGDYGDVLMSQPFRVMEVKVADAMPLWMTRILSELKIYPGSFSKYGAIHRASLGHNDNRGNEICSQVS